MAEIKLPTMSYKEIGEKWARYALDEVKYNGLTIQQWADKITGGEYAPIVHGHWERIDDPEFICGDFECSNCSHREDEIDTDVCTPGVNCLHYCPNCGAKMDEEAQNDP